MAQNVPLLATGLAALALACAPSDRDPPPRAREVPAVTAAAAEPSTATSAATATSTATSTATPAATPTARPPSAPATTILRAALALEPAGAGTTASRGVKLVPGSEVVVDPAATFEVELSAQCADARLVLVDARDDHLAATATREVGAGTRLTLAPTAPLVPGSRYALRLDGAADRDLHDGAGQAYSAVTLPLLAAGSPPPPEPKKKKAAAKRRRR